MTLFPELHHRLTDIDYTPYSLFLDLRAQLEGACIAGDDEHLGRLFQFAAWCLGQDRVLENAAIAGFYAHVFEDCSDWDRVLDHISPDQISDWWVFWELSMQPVEMRKLYLAIARKHGSGMVETPARWYLEDVAPDEEATEAALARQRDYLYQLLRNSLGFYSAGRLELWQLAKDVEICLRELSRNVDREWLWEAHDIWAEIEVINAVSLHEERSTLAALKAGERRRVSQLVASLQEMIPIEVE